MVPAMCAEDADKFPSAEIVTRAGCLVPDRDCIIDPAVTLQELAEMAERRVITPVRQVPESIEVMLAGELASYKLLSAGVA